MTKKTLDISNPDIDFVNMAEAMGVKANRASKAEEFNVLLSEAMNEQGQRLIEAMVVQ
ncbi:MAG: thiamine pyrophosphate-dependent enzyme [Pseudomonadota bacterium]